MENSEYLKFKHEDPKHLDLLERCYKDVIAIGYCTLAPYEDLSSDEGGNNNDGNASGVGIGLGGEDGGNSEETDEGVENIVSSSNKDQRKKKRGGKVDKRIGAAKKLQESLNHILGGIDEMSKTMMTKSSIDDPCNMTNCLKLLNEVPG
ncbi:L10-interacting MYB domain-containing protein-like [Senna tora]|uniref:L10-interacting MYB domain-containing protein-like n=1 Tax=Senna tora TaxID=362788 RepID=A0A834WN34_9FABA|nr:L10-interacting MYB domain-containing protein-like [Senna tora]